MTRALSLRLGRVEIRGTAVLAAPGSTVVPGGNVVPGGDTATGGRPQRGSELRRFTAGAGRNALLFALIAVPAVTLRVWHLDTVGYNSDEAVYAGQGASLAGVTSLQPFFPVFRAHPLLFQATLSLLYRVVGLSELAGRLLSVAFGLGTVAVVYLLGRRMFGARVGWLAALIVAVMPYTTVVSRQVLLDGPMTFFATLSLYLFARYVDSRRPPILYAAACALGLSVLTKETSILLVGGVFAFFALMPRVIARPRHLLVALGAFLAISAVYPLSVSLSGVARTGGNFLVWQLLRRPNHSWSFYPTVVPAALGWPAVVAAAAGLLGLRRTATWREGLLICWVVGPLLFFELWSVKGYQYLLPISAPVAVLAARALLAIPVARIRLGRIGSLPGRAVRTLAVAGCVASLLAATYAQIAPSGSGTTFLAGTGGVPGGREAGRWIDAHVPQGAELIAIGPSMANIVEFYGRRLTFGLSVSPNPLHRNPVYEALTNPDLRIRHNDIQYLVWDSYSASRTKFFAAKLLTYARRYNGRIVHTECVDVDTGGRTVCKPVIVVYQVRPS